MKKLILFVLLAVCTSANATTWYVRTDGGTATQCTGTTNAPYPGTGTGVACAVNHIYWLLNQSTWTWLTAANDTVQFEDNGPYYQGLQHNGLGLFWSHCSGASADCFLPPPPNGTKIYGKNVGSCTALTGRTQLVGINYLYKMIYLQGTTDVDMECLDITSASTCTVLNVNSYLITSTALTANVATYGFTYSGHDQQMRVDEPITITGTTNGGGIFNVSNAFVTSITGSLTGSGTITIALTHADVTSAAESGHEYYSGNCSAPSQSHDYAASGIVMETANLQGPTNLTLKDISIHGMAASGILGSKYNGVNFTNLYIAGNGESGLDADGGGCGNNCESAGTMNMSHITSNWNGCVEVIPNGGTIGGNGYNYCVDQAYGGNGDAIVMIATGGTWNWSDISMSYNVQDGFDSLHVGDDATAQPTTTATRIYSMGNEGQSIKGGGGLFTLTDSIGISNCDVFALASNFPLNPTGWNVLTQQRCRANDSMAFAMRSGNTLDIENVVNAGQQGVAWDFSTNSCTSASVCNVTFKNNATMGFINPPSGNYMGPSFFGTVNPFSDAIGSIASNNSWYHIGNTGSSCPNFSNEINQICSNPLFVSQSNVDAMNVQLTSGSPLIGKGVNIPGLTTDFANNPWLNPPSIGAYEFGSAPPTASTTLNGHVVFSGNVRF